MAGHHIPLIGLYNFFSLYCAVDDQLKRLGDNGLGIDKLRNMTSQYLLEHKSDFLPFLSHPDTGDVLTDAQFEEYCDEVASTSAWGGEVEVSVLIVKNITSLP